MSSSFGWNRSTFLTLVSYLVMVGGTIAVFFWIRGHGAGLVAPAPAAEAARFGSSAGQAKANDFFHVLIALIVIIATARLVGAL
ncbi:MAG TPA: hypothetical protein VMM92_09545, partial [Thermoanaerobaculia bacterium]|nr:hypothetical protein [Thermoanaerobaculia bacterium]